MILVPNDKIIFYYYYASFKHTISGYGHLSEGVINAQSG